MANIRYRISRLSRKSENIARRRDYFKKQRLTALIGWLGGLLLALCGLPQAVQSVQQGHSQGVSELFITMWGVGEILLMVYVLRSRAKPDWPLLFNYAMNLTFIGIIAYYML